MKSSTKAACLSAFLFPGSGHLYLKCYFRGLLFLVIATIALLVFMNAVFEIVWTIANDIETGKQVMDKNLIQTLIRDSINLYQQPQMRPLKLAIIGVWIISTADAWRVGHHLEKHITADPKVA